MSAPYVWWANRKSRMGLKPSAKVPPHHHDGREWWTAPPTAPPEPAHVEYVAEFHRRLVVGPKSKHRDAMIKYLADWMKGARRLMHERAEHYGPPELQSMDGLLEAAW